LVLRNTHKATKLIYQIFGNSFLKYKSLFTGYDITKTLRKNITWFHFWNIFELSCERMQLDVRKLLLSCIFVLWVTLYGNFQQYVYSTTDYHIWHELLTFDSICIFLLVEDSHYLFSVLKFHSQYNSLNSVNKMLLLKSTIRFQNLILLRLV
jgi:hypothetical protein